MKKQLAKDAYKGWRKKVFKKKVKEFNPSEYPKKHSKETIERACNVFGHICPAFFVNEPLTETIRLRRISRHIPREIMLRVVRRDNHTCQICGRHLKDGEIEFDHKIPISLGGSGEESNVQLACFDCNRVKGKRKPKNILGFE